MNIGPYNLVKKIAEGGFSDIYLAKSQTLSGTEKYLVCKCLKASFVEDEEFLNSVRNEVALSNQLNHPNILEIFDLCRCNGSTFLTMEYMDGLNCRELLTKNAEKNRTVPIDVAIYMIGQAALGLHAAHELKDKSGNPLNLVHRDISPENILFGTNGDIKICDFGIAKTSAMPDITPQDVIKGKFNYMSPEHAWGDKLDRRADLFSLAVIFYEATVGRSFYPTESISDTISCARMTIYELPKTINPNYPDDVDIALRKAFELDKKKRYATVLEFKEALDACAAAHHWHVTRESWAQYLRMNLDLDKPLPLMHKIERIWDPGIILDFNAGSDDNRSTELITSDAVARVRERLGLTLPDDPYNAVTESINPKDVSAVRDILFGKDSKTVAEQVPAGCFDPDVMTERDTNYPSQKGINPVSADMPRPTIPDVDLPKPTIPVMDLPKPTIPDFDCQGAVGYSHLDPKIKNNLTADALLNDNSQTMKGSIFSMENAETVKGTVFSDNQPNATGSESVPDENPSDARPAGNDKDRVIRTLIVVVFLGIGILILYFLWDLQII
ncbi:MAG: serine/threonine protein kinase [Proteobacteria bacterium]|nr:serine/threonine protein kinase [Pseudomonadota bacterium]